MKWQSLLFEPLWEWWAWPFLKTSCLTVLSSWIFQEICTLFGTLYYNRTCRVVATRAPSTSRHALLSMSTADNLDLYYTWMQPWWNTHSPLAFCPDEMPTCTLIGTCSRYALTFPSRKGPSCPPLPIFTQPSLNWIQKGRYWLTSTRRSSVCSTLAKQLLGEQGCRNDLAFPKDAISGGEKQDLFTIRIWKDGKPPFRKVRCDNGIATYENSCTFLGSLTGLLNRFKFRGYLNPLPHIVAKVLPL